jgi:hypothetical protein
MCQSYRKACVCGENTAEIFFGRAVLDEKAISRVFCPNCSPQVDADPVTRVLDNGWILEIDIDAARARASVMDISPDKLTAEWVFDEGYATWVGMTPDDFQKRESERAEIQGLAKTDVKAYIHAIKEWGLSREKRLAEEGWRKALGPVPHGKRRHPS